MIRVMRWAWYRVGRRGCTLLFLAFLDCLVGWSLLTAPVLLARMDLLLPLTTWGWIWIAVGVICAVFSVVEQDRVAFTAASALKVSWAAANLNAWTQGLPRAWVNVAIWLAFGGLILLIGSWPESPDVMAVRTRRTPPVTLTRDGERR